MTFNHKAFYDDLRASWGKVTQAQVNALNSAIDAGFGKKATNEPAWMVEARKMMGQREIKGPKHNNWIAKGWARLGASWFNNDETPWCGFFVAHCMDKAGLPYPGGGLFARAKAWLDWGVPCQPCLGAVIVFGRSGGGHVGFVVGEGQSTYYVLGGNQRDAVNIMPIAKSRYLGCRWPKGVKNPATKLPSMTGGIVSRNEA